MDNSYMANGSACGFWWVGGNTNGKPTFLNTVKQPSPLCLIHEDTEDWELGNCGTPPGSWFGTDSARGNVIVTDASISIQRGGAFDVSPDDLGHACAIRAFMPPFWKRIRPPVPVYGLTQAI